ncbi:hypothetical protein SAMN05216330_116102 [Bradyrhizobium sp. Ghvi]|nr:hypothetical protein SAMN05216330_116102 [Bradyrhizobium sp. Ghvi]
MTAPHKQTDRNRTPHLKQIRTKFYASRQVDGSHFAFPSTAIRVV